MQTGTAPAQVSLAALDKRINHLYTLVQVKTGVFPKGAKAVLATPEILDELGLPQGWLMNMAMVHVSPYRNQVIYTADIGQLSDEALMGILAHELAHADLRVESLFLPPIEAEREADRWSVEHGFGRQAIKASEEIERAYQAFIGFPMGPKDHDDDVTRRVMLTRWTEDYERRHPSR